VMHREFGERTAEVPLAQRYQPVQTLFLNRSDKPLRVRIAVRRTKWCLNNAHARCLEPVPHNSNPSMPAHDMPLPPPMSAARLIRLTFSDSAGRSGTAATAR